MIISQTPFRISFVGGGSDLKEYYKNGFGAVVSTTIDKYVYITVNKRFDNTIRLSYSKTETVDHVDDLQNDIVRECLKKVDITKGIEITSIADLPSGTGMGSSSSFCVGVLNALYAYKGVYKTREDLYKEACEIEIDILKNPIGKQDQAAAAFGGFNYIKFNSDETTEVEPIICSRETKKALSDSLMLFYTGITRSASAILSEQKENTMSKKDYMDNIVALNIPFKEVLSSGINLGRIGHLLHEGWTLKKIMASTITNDLVNQGYKTAILNGALGGKLLGAGGGGFLLFYVEEQNKLKVKTALENIGLKEMKFNFDPMGSRIIFIGQ